MPIYEYKCNQCGNVTEVIQKVSDAHLKCCQECGGKLKKLVSSPAIQFKGTGWYVTDYARSGKNGTDNKKPAANEEAEKTSDVTAKKEDVENKPATKKEIPSSASTN